MFLFKNVVLICVSASHYRVGGVVHALVLTEVQG